MVRGVTLARGGNTGPEGNLLHLLPDLRSLPRMYLQCRHVLWYHAAIGSRSVHLPHAVFFF